jgi:phosphonate transport system ATP-binding protein
MQPAIRVTSLSKSFGPRRALETVNLEVMPGEMVALIGASGSGKSTLLRHIAGLVCGDPCADQRGGEVLVHGEAVQCRGRLSPQIRRVRAGIGFVFQQFNLVGRLSLIHNVMAGALNRMPLRRSLPRLFSQDELALGFRALQRVGIADRAAQRASTLSGGQQQRAAIARTLVQGAKIVLADEPIASLDPESSRRVMEILAEINEKDGCTVLVSLHQVTVAVKYCPRTVALRHGRVVYDGPSANLTPALLRELYGAEADEILKVADHNSAPQEREDVRRPAEVVRLAAQAI